ncbi:NACHT domain-containing protein [Actinoplanes sp. NPDC000266]
MTNLILGLIVGSVATIVGWLSVLGLRDRLERARLVLMSRSRAGDRRQVRRRQLFADHLESRLRRWDEQSLWRDSRYVDLEAEVEEMTRVPGFSGRRHLGLRRVNSVSRALIEAGSRVVYLEGHPGSGKTVALRHVAHMMLWRAMSHATVIPLYVNLQQLAVGDGDPVDAALIRRYVLEQLNPARSREVDEYLDEEFDAGVAKGTWYFLFDSFDEIPAVLAAGGEFETTVERYAAAIFGFLDEVAPCRAVVASRFFKGPRRFGLARMTIVPLTVRGRAELIRRAALDRDLEKITLDEFVHSTRRTSDHLSSNPLALGLICEHVRLNRAVPRSAYQMYEAYVREHLHRNGDAVERASGLSLVEVRAIAEELAFLMAHELHELAPTRVEATEALGRHGFEPVHVAAAFQALQTAHLATDPGSPDEDRVSFSHRRIQEYFATCAVITRPERVDYPVLVTDPLWHEVAVALLQTQEPDRLDPALTAMRQVLDGPAAELAAEAESRPPDEVRPPFRWPSETERLLLIADTGFKVRADGTSSPEMDALRRLIGEVLRSAWQIGRRHDRKAVLGLVAGADRATAAEVVGSGLGEPGDWVPSAALARVHHAGELSEHIAGYVKRSLVGRSRRFGFTARRAALRADLRRLDRPEPFLRVLDLLLWLPLTDLLLSASVVLLWRLVLVPPDGVVLAGNRYSPAELTIAALLLTALTVPLSGALAKRARFFARTPSEEEGKPGRHSVSLPTGPMAIAFSLALRAVAPAAMVAVTGGAGAPGTALLFWPAVIWMATWLYASLYLISYDAPARPELWWGHPVKAVRFAAQEAMRFGRKKLSAARALAGLMFVLTAAFVVSLSVAFALGALLMIGRTVRWAMAGQDRHTGLNDLTLALVTLTLTAAALALIAATGRILAHRRRRRAVLQAADEYGLLDPMVAREWLGSDAGTAMAVVITELGLAGRIDLADDTLGLLADLAAESERDWIAAYRKQEPVHGLRTALSEQAMDDVARLLDRTPHTSRRPAGVRV